GELRRGTAQQWHELGAALARESVRRRRDRERSDELVRSAHHRDRDAPDPVVVLLVVDRVATLADLLDRAPPPGRTDDRVPRVWSKLQAVEDAVAPRRRERGEQRLTCPGRVQRHA